MKRDVIGVKKANTPIEYTKEDIRELMKCAQDPIHFIKNYIKVDHPIKGSIPFELYDYQENMVRLFESGRFSIVLSARQTGKCLEYATHINTKRIKTGFLTRMMVKLLHL